MNRIKTPNVNLRKHKRKKGNSYYLDYFIDGKRVKETIGIVSPFEANEKLAMKQDEIRRYQGLKPSHRPNISLKEAIDIHCRLKESSVRKRTINSYKNYRERIFSVIDDLGESNYSNLRTITEGRFNILAKKLRSDYTNQNTANNTLTFLKAVENTAIKKDYLDKKFSTDIKISKPEPKLTVQFYTNDELEKIWAHCDEFYLPMYKLISSTGLRLGELVNLTWDKVDTSNKQIHVDVRVSKTDGSVLWRPKSKSSIRSVPLSKKAKEIILAQKGKHNKLVFISKNGKQLHSNTVYKPFVVARDKAGIQDKGAIHTLRHTFASICAQNGIPLFKIGHYLGHSSEKSTRIYAHLSPSDDAEEFNKIGL